MSNLMQASNQWARRPDDERYLTLDAMYAACKAYADSAVETVSNYRDLEVAHDDGDLRLLGSEHAARFTHYGFGQFCARLRAPADYLRRLPANVASDVLNHHLGERQDEPVNMLAHANGDLVLRSFTSEQYSRIWNWEVLDRLRPMQDQGWHNPVARAQPSDPGAFTITQQHVDDGILRGRINLGIGSVVRPSGLYASDHDMFAFLVNENSRIDDGTDEGLGRGVFVSNSEVGAAALKVTRFLYRYVCANHIIWDAKDVKELRIVHRGNADRRFSRQLIGELRTYANESTASDQARIDTCKRVMLGSNKEEVLDRLFGARILPMRTLDAAYEQAVIDVETTGSKVSPRSAWGVMQGITRLSQRETWADRRVELDRAAGKIPTMKF